MKVLGAGTLLWCGVHLFGAEKDQQVIAKLGGGRQGRQAFTLLYYALSAGLYLAQVYLYQRVFTSTPLPATYVWPGHLPKFLESNRENIRLAVAISTSVARYLAVFLTSLATFTRTTPPNSRVVLKHDGFHTRQAQAAQAQDVAAPAPTTAAATAVEVPAWGLGRITRHPINTALVIFALSHLTPSDSATKWQASALFWGPQLLLAIAGTFLQDQRLARDPSGTYKRYLKESSLLPNPFALFNMPSEERAALAKPAAAALAIASAFFAFPKLNRLLYAPTSGWLPLTYMALETIYSSPAAVALLPNKEDVAAAVRPPTKKVEVGGADADPNVAAAVPVRAPAK
ncbi:hypothetical protein JKP88DRAFT_261586 [Tribonema minus]|uniref:Uncharacterized protein n=1 Tax=Tribonema minus TaxID=303371 RepID=A0A836C994_9STRA|nr:hypothetical protein JKP88DRAFT_261586 [Tribonema minus]